MKIALWALWLSCFWFLIGVYVTWQPHTFNRMYEEFIWFQMYEDGSYVAETVDNTYIRGCIVGAICND